MGIFSRLSDIVNSNLNAMLAQAEDPKKIIRLIIQEMEDTLVEVRSQAVRTIAERKELERKIAATAREEAEWARKAELALTHNREDLARGALAAKGHVTKTRETLEEQLIQIRLGLAQQDDDIAKLQAKLADAKSREQALRSRHDLANSRLRVKESLYDSRINDAFSRFEQVERNLDALEGRSEAWELGRRGSVPSLHDELAGLENDVVVEDELARLKAKLGRGQPGTSVTTREGE